MSILTGYTIEQVSKMAEDNSSLRGIIQGYRAEYELKDLLLAIPGVSSAIKIPDRSKDRGDFEVIYKGTRITIEAKSIGTKSVRPDILNDSWEATVSVKNTDKRIVQLKDKEPLATSALIRGEFDILAISCFAVSQKWEFLYMENKYIPAKSSEYPQLLKTSFKINPEVTPCVTSDIHGLLEEVFTKKTINTQSKIGITNKE